MKKILSIVLVIAIIASLGLGTYALFTDYATETRNGNAGTLDADDGKNKGNYVSLIEIWNESNNGESEEVIDYVPFTVTADNRAQVGYTGKANEDFVIPATFQDSDGTWY